MSDTAEQTCHEVDTPRRLSKQAWLEVAKRTYRELDRDNVPLIAAGVGFFALLAAFPALSAIVAIYGLVTTPAEVSEHLGTMVGVLPPEAASVFEEQLKTLTQRKQQSLGIGVAIGIGAALWSARKGMVALVAANNIAYGETETRGFFGLLLTSMAFTLGAVVYFLLVLLLALATPIALEALLPEGFVQSLALVLRWPLLWLLVVIGLAAVYRYAPHRARAKWRWVSWGAALAATLWLLGTVGFSLYVRNFGNYEETYGALGGVIILMLWLYLSGYIVILGAEVNAELERQTSRDTTTGPEQPMGERGAVVADSVV